MGKPTEFKDVFELVQYHGSTPTSTTDGTCLKYPCPVAGPGGADDDDENPYVDLVNDGKVNQEALDQARRMSKDKADKLSTIQNQKPAAAAGAAKKTSVKGVTSSGYEFVEIPGKKLNAVSE